MPITVTGGGGQRGPDRVNYSKFPLRQLVTDLSASFQLDFAEQGAALLQGFSGLHTQPSGSGLILTAVAERDLIAAVAMLEVAFPAVRAGAVEVVYLDHGRIEPYVRVRVTTPEDYCGDVIDQLNRRRGLIESLDDAGDRGKTVVVSAPLAAMLGYDSVVAATTRGRATVEYEFVDYRPVIGAAADH
jgi:hypothetical protein